MPLYLWVLAFAIGSNFLPNTSCADPLVVKCSSQVVARSAFDADYKDGLIDLSKILAVTPISKEDFTITFDNPNSFKFSYDVRIHDNIIKSATIQYPQGSDAGNLDKAMKQFNLTTGPFNSVGIYQFKSYFFNNQLNGTLAQANKLGENDQTVQYQLDGAVKSTIIVTDKTSTKVLYVVSIPLKDPKPFDTMNKEYRQKFQNLGLTEEQIEAKLTALDSNPALQKAFTQMTEQLKSLPKDVQIDTYSPSN